MGSLESVFAEERGATATAGELSQGAAPAAKANPIAAKELMETDKPMKQMYDALASWDFLREKGSKMAPFLWHNLVAGGFDVMRKISHLV